VSQSYPKFDRPLAVLQVDDDPMNLRVVEEILTAFNHIAVKVTSGREALQLIAERRFDVVLMDIHMPGMTGIEAVERLRAAPGPERGVGRPAERHQTRRRAAQGPLRRQRRLGRLCRNGKRRASAL
jgi:CheY-like chemotaxis protein